jgi:hypothetical protein
MPKLEDTVIKTKDRALQEFITELVSFWNLGKYSFSKISAEPTDTPQDVEIRIFDSGAGAVRLYVFVPGSGQSGSGWWKTDNFTEVT